LRTDGHDVELLERSSESVGPARSARGLLAGGLDPEEVRDAVRRLKADVVHAHNLHPLFGWRALAAARAAGARTVLHLHNFRLFCAIGIAYRAGAPCFRCRGTNTLPGLRLRCRGSLGEAAVYAAALHRQQPRLLEHADAIVAVSQATAARLTELGLPAERLSVLPNFVRAAERSGAQNGEVALAAGRLVEEKGFDTAIAAARAAGVPLTIAGSGPDEPRLRSLADETVTFTGLLSSTELARLRARAAVVLAPSRWEEPCPYAVLDALAAGVPVLVSDRGGLAELVGPESVLPAEDRTAWTEALRALWEEPERRRVRGEEALTRARERLGEERYLKRLLEIYAPSVSC
jgi:glycosyltransferase involved in cell wall biosynthesis